MKTNLTLFTFCCSFIFILSACYSINKAFNPEMQRVIGSKVIGEEERKLDAFSVVDIRNLNVHLIQDTVNKIRLVGEDNVIKEFHAIVKNDTLSVEPTPYSMMTIHTPLELYLHFTDIDKLTGEYTHYYSEGTITTQKIEVESRTNGFYLDLDCDSLIANLYGNGKCHALLRATGHAEWSDVNLVINGAFDSPEFSGNELYIDYEEKSYYRIKLKNFEYTNVLLPTNSLTGPYNPRTRELRKAVDFL